MITRTVLAVDLTGEEAAIQSYRQHHQEVWPEVVASLRRSGITQMDIYLLGRRLVMILETDGQDFRRCFAAHVASSPRVAEWEQLMRSMQAVPPGAAPGDWWTPMELVFCLERAEDAQPAPHAARRT
jgi:L-rhamnose mutarotase